MENLKNSSQFKVYILHLVSFCMIPTFKIVEVILANDQIGIGQTRISTDSQGLDVISYNYVNLCLFETDIIRIAR